MPSPTVDDSTSPEPDAPVEPGDGSARRRRLLTWIGAGVAVAVVAAAGLVWGLRGDDGSAASATPSASPSSAAPTEEPTGAPTDGATDEPTDAPEGEAAAGAEGEAGAAPADPEAPVERPTAAPVPLDGTAEPAPQVQVRLTSIEPVEGVANLPGEVGGPSLRVTVTVTNTTEADLDLTTAVVNLYVGPDRAPAIDLREPGRRDFPASVKPGRESSGAFVFLVPEDQRDQVLVELDLSTAATVVLFEGPVTA